MAQPVATPPKVVVPMAKTLAVPKAASTRPANPQASVEKSIPKAGESKTLPAPNGKAKVAPKPEPGKVGANAAPASAVPAPAVPAPAAPAKVGPIQVKARIQLGNVAIQGQIAVQRGQQMNDENDRDSISYPTDQTIQWRVGEAQRLAASNELPRAISLFQTILDVPEDSFIPETVKGEKKWRTTRSVVEDYIANPPPNGLGAKGLEEYRRQFNPQAAHLLQQAIAGRDPSAIADVGRRFFLTSAGMDATNYLASYHLDRGQPAAALVYLDHLLLSPAHRDRATDVMRVKRAVALALLGRSESAHEALAHTGNDRLPLGGTIRNQASVWASIGRLLQARARNLHDTTSTHDHEMGLPLLAPELVSGHLPLFPSVEPVLLGNFLDQNRHQSRPTFLGSEPVPYGDTLYYRDMQGTWAIDGRTGKRLWGNSEGRTVISEIERYSNNNQYGRNATPIALESTYWTNSLYGHLTVDNDFVYRIDNLILDPNSYFYHFANRTVQEEVTHRSRNRLTALARRTGKPVWQVGDANKPATVFKELPDAYFLGPPLSLDGKLYILAESRSEIVLVCLDAATGHLLWKQGLVLADHKIDVDLLRRSQACTIVAAEGLLLCPTNLFQVFAFDPLARAVLWEASFPEDRVSNYRRYANEMQAVQPPPNAYATDAPLLANGRVFITSAIARSVHCRDLGSGREIWRVERTQDHSMVAVADEMLLLLGNRHLRALQTRDGKQAWSQPLAAVPAGRGVVVGTRYLVPLRNGEIQAFDISTGQKGDCSRCRDEEMLGSLRIWEQRAVVWGPQGLRIFPLSESLRQQSQRLLASNSRDPRGLYLHAHLSLARGDSLEAVECLRQALSQTKFIEERSLARSLLFDIASRTPLTNGPVLTSLVEQLHQLAVTPVERGIALRLQAEQRLAAGDDLGALNAVQQHGSLEIHEPLPGEEGKVRRSPRVWSEFFLKRLAEKAVKTKNSRLLEELQNRARQALGSNDSSQMELLVHQLGGAPVADELWLGLGVHPQRSSSAREYALMHAASSATPEVAAAALLQLAKLAETEKMTADALAFVKLAATRYPYWRGPEGKNTIELLHQFHNDAARMKAAERAVTWEFAAISSSTGHNGSPSSQYLMLPHPHDALPFFEDRMLVTRSRASGAYNTPQLRVDMVNRFEGTPEWGVNLNIPRQRTIRPNMPFHHLGHLFFLAQGEIIYGISALERKELWSHSFGKERAETNNNGVRTNVVFQQFGDDGTIVNDGTNAVIGPVGPGFVVVRKGKELRVLDPLTGVERWALLAGAPDLMVFGDRDYLFVMTSTFEYTVHAMRDGQILRKGRFSSQSRPTTSNVIGRNLLLFGDSPQGVRLRLWDPWRETDIWRRDFARGTRYFQGNDQVLALLEPDGELHFLDRAKGFARASDHLNLKTLGPINYLRIFTDHQRIYAALELANRRNVAFYSTFGAMATVPVNGQLRVYDRSTHQLSWLRDLESASISLGIGAELPVLFAFMRQSPNRQRCDLQIIDKRDGTTRITCDFQTHTGVSEMAFNGREKWIELRSWNSWTRFTLLSATEAKSQLRGERLQGLFFNTIHKIGDAITHPKPTPDSKNPPKANPKR